MMPLFQITHTYPDGTKSIFRVEKPVWERWQAWSAVLDRRLAAVPHPPRIEPDHSVISMAEPR